MAPQTAKYIIGIGLLITIIGVIWYFLGDKLGWIGRLPGDIRIQKPGFSFYFPITTGILASLLLSVLVYLIKRYF